MAIASTIDDRQVDFDTSTPKRHKAGSSRFNQGFNRPLGLIKGGELLVPEKFSFYRPDQPLCFRISPGIIIGTEDLVDPKKAMLVIKLTDAGTEPLSDN